MATTQDSDPSPTEDGDATMASGPRTRRPSTPVESEVRSVDRGAEETARRAVPDARGDSLPSYGASDTELSFGEGATSATRAEQAIAHVMAAEEGTRARGFAFVIFVISSVVAVSLPLMGGDPDAKRVAIASLAVMALASLWVWRHLRIDTSFYTRRVHRLYGALLVTGVLAVEYYFGFFSPVVVVVTLGVFYLGQTATLRDSLMLPLFAMASYATGAILTAVGVLPERGLFPADDTDLVSLLFSVGAVLGVLAITLRMARVGRASMQDAIRRSNEALLLAQRQEAQLAEAHHQLDRALKLAIGKPGRFTGVRAGDYELDVVIGIGAMGEVYGAKHVETAQGAAVKLMHADVQARDELVQRFLREGEICGRLMHPNLVRVHGVGQLDSGEPYMAMEKLEGMDLAARLREEGMLGLAELARLARDLGAALEHAHEVGVVHRDLKPLNVFESREKGGRRRWKILDFGISKLQGSNSTLTQMSVVGTPGYMSPEQARGLSVDHRSDIFAMGVVLYRAMTGRPAFGGKDTPQILFDVVYRSPARPSSVAEHLPHDLDLVMAIAMAKDPEDRFDSAWELSTAVRAACARRLPNELRARGEALVARHPWNETHGARADNGASDRGATGG